MAINKIHCTLLIWHFVSSLKATKFLDTLHNQIYVLFFSSLARVSLKFIPQPHTRISIYAAYARSRHLNIFELSTSSFCSRHQEKEQQNEIFEHENSSNRTEATNSE